jgi:predicted NAD/FAD-binding protein
MSFSVRCERSGLEYNGSSLGGLFAQRRNLLRPRFWGMLRDILRFNRDARALVAQAPTRGRADSPTVGDFVRAGGYSREFIEHYLLPMGSAIWSCPTGTFPSFSMQMVAEFFHHHGLLNLRDRPQWRVIVGGSRSYVQALAARMTADVQVNAPIERIWRRPHHVDLAPRCGPVQTFDHVVLACHSDQALRMLADPTALELELLSAFPYERNIAILHTDTSLLPHCRRAWASWNYHLPSQPVSRATVTYCMNILQHLQSRHTYCVTLNREEDVDPKKLLRRFLYEHPVFTAARIAARQRHAELINVNRTSYCGAYWGNGFHEDGVVSALAVCQALNCQTRQQLNTDRRHANPNWVANAVL